MRILFLLLSLLAGIALQSLQVTAFAADGNEVMDFEGDVIEGQNKAPELFLQLDVEKPDLSAVLYDRKDFNDFHRVDGKRRPMLSNPKAVAK